MEGDLGDLKQRLHLLEVRLGASEPDAWPDPNKLQVINPNPEPSLPQPDPDPQPPRPEPAPPDPKPF
jgi:colicin import membrane protein